jgi:hypothetical protein
MLYCWILKTLPWPHFLQVWDEVLSLKTQQQEAGPGLLGLPKQDPEFSSQDGLPSGYVKIAIENGHL